MKYTLRTENTVATADSIGAELISYVNRGKEYIWEGLAEHWTGHAPTLFPVVCSPKDGKIIADGTEYPMPKHGIARKNDFTVSQITSDKAVFTMRDTEETLRSYPYNFLLKVTHVINENGYETKYKVENTGSKEMPFCIGGHPSIKCPMNREESFEDYSIIFDDASDSVMSITQEGTGYMCPDIPKLDLIKNNELRLRYSDYDHDALIIEGLKKKGLKLINRNTGHGIRFDFDGFDVLGIWTPEKKHSPFLCLEPWCGLPASTAETPALTDKKYIRTIGQGETFSVGFKFTII